MWSRSDSITRVLNDEVLNLDALQPGDIILSRPATWESSWIAIFGLSRFSHASLVVLEDMVDVVSAEAGFSARGRPHTLLIEATTDQLPGTDEIVGGVGYWPLGNKWIRKHGSSEVPTGNVFPLNKYAYFEVFRHRSSATEEFQAFVQYGITASCRRYLNEPYARLSDLSKVSVAPWFVRLAGNWLMHLPKSQRAGLFCSQLVAAIYHDGGFPLSAKEPSLVRPRDLARASNLERITYSTRRRLRPEEELIGLRQVIEAALPDFLSDIARETEPNILERLLQDEDSDPDFQGRLTAWRMRDHKETAKRHCEEMARLGRALKDAVSTLTEQVKKDSEEMQTQLIRELPPKNSKK